MPELPAQLSVALDLEDGDDDAALRTRVASQIGVSPDELPTLRVLQRSLDARGGRARFRLLVALGAQSQRPAGPPIREVGAPLVVIVGAGPAGLFCAYELARHGVGSMLLDRGKPVQPRRHDLKAVLSRGDVNPDSNYCFGEGGAGTYSDGKLYTRSHKRGNVRDVIEILALCGAPDAVLTDARPHIGSNRLPIVIGNLRARLMAVGVSFEFGARVVGLCVKNLGAQRRVTGVRLADGRELEARAVVMATGHSARDVLLLLAEHGVRLEPKPFAVGVRIEHPQPLIDRIQYGALAGHPRLPSAYYRLATNVEGRGVFSFCMCPGGFVIPASTASDELVLNGMSLSRRNSPFANSGLVVGVEPAELEAAGYHGWRGGVELQQRLERIAFEAGGGAQRAPATRTTDFARGRGSSTVPKSSYVPGTCAADVGDVLDSAGLVLSGHLRAALEQFNRKMRGYLTEEAVLLGVESRTSSPVRVPRVPAELCSTEFEGLYPCGEGAGYAGGIVSAAVDGMRVARAIAGGLGQNSALSAPGPGSLRCCS
jgi:hypothetical protein